MKSKTVLGIAAVTAIAVVAAWALDIGHTITGGHSRAVKSLIARNIEARGGADAWRSVTSLRLAGQMDLGQGMHVPYTIDQKRPERMCLEFEFEKQTATQCVAEGSGWKVLPYLGRDVPEVMTTDELRAMSESASIDGLLFDSERRGYTIEILGHEQVQGRDTVKLEVTLPAGSKRWVYLDAETALEVRMDSLRKLRGRERLVETYYYDWRETDGLLISRRQVTTTDGMEGSNFLTVENVAVNPPVDDERFRMPLAEAGNGSGGNAS